MTIETKYNIGEWVWGASHEEIWCGVITEITTYHTFGMRRIEYKVLVEEEMHFTFKESDLFPTKEELLKSLKSMLHKGDRVWFKGDKKPFRVRAANDRFAICTKPYNFQPNTVIYTIVDFEWGVRGMDNMIFGIYSYYSDEECEEALQALINGDLEVSSKTHKHTRLEIERIVKHSNV